MKVSQIEATPARLADDVIRRVGIIVDVPAGSREYQLGFMEGLEAGFKRGVDSLIALMERDALGQVADENLKETA